MFNAKINELDIMNSFAVTLRGLSRQKKIILAIAVVLSIAFVVWLLLAKPFTESAPKQPQNPIATAPKDDQEPLGGEKKEEQPPVKQKKPTKKAPKPKPTPSSGRTPSAGGSAPSSPTPTPSSKPPATSPPVVSLLGWQLTPNNTGLKPKGLSCASLPLYSGSGKPAPGTKISKKRITKPLNLSRGNILIEQSCIKPTSVIGQALVTTSDYDSCTNTCPVTSANVTIRDSEIDGSAMSAQQVAYSCAFLGVGILQRNYIHDTGSGICFFNTGNKLSATAEGNYVHRLRAYGDPATTGSHNESFTIRDFDTSSVVSRRLLVRNNRLDSSSGSDTGALFIQTYGGDINNVRIEGNLLEGQGYQLVLEGGFGNSYGHSMVANNNRFSGTGYGAGYVDDKGLGYGWSQFQNNYLNDPTKTGNKGSVVTL